MTSNKEAGDILFEQAIKSNNRITEFFILVQGIEYYNHYKCFEQIWKCPKLYNILSKERVNDLFLEDSARSNFLIGYFNYFGINHCQMNEFEAFKFFQRSASQDFNYSIFLVGWCLKNGNCIASNQIRAYEYYQEAMKRGVSEAFYGVGLAYMSLMGPRLELPFDNYLAAIYYNKAVKLGCHLAKSSLDQLLKYNTSLIPWGKWNIQNHFLIPDNVKDAIFTWLLIYKKLNVSKGVHIIILEYICTRSEW